MSQHLGDLVRILQLKRGGWCYRELKPRQTFQPNSSDASPTQGAILFGSTALQVTCHCLVHIRVYCV